MAPNANGRSAETPGTEHGETSPLLSPAPRQSSPEPTAASTEPLATPESPLFRRTIILLFALTLFLTLAVHCWTRPRCDCLRWLSTGTTTANMTKRHREPPLSYVDEKLCKLNPIQVDLVNLRACKGLLTTIPGILLSIPYGHLSDKIGRQPLPFLDGLAFPCPSSKIYSSARYFLSP